MLATAMGCPDPVGGAASAYQSALVRTARFTIDGDRLTLFDEAGDPLAVHRSAP